MGFLEIIIIIAAVLIVAGVIGYSIYKKVTGKPGSCDCGSAYGCGDCHNCSHYKTSHKNEEDK